MSIVRRWFVVQCRRRDGKSWNDEAWWNIGADFDTAEDAFEFAGRRKTGSLKKAQFRVVRYRTGSDVVGEI